MTEAKDCACVECGGQAVAFWPVVDLDIPSYPFCRTCLDREKMKLLLRLLDSK